jgi:hypothetical protein
VLAALSLQMIEELGTPPEKVGYKAGLIVSAQEYRFPVSILDRSSVFYRKAHLLLHSSLPSCGGVAFQIESVEDRCSFQGYWELGSPCPCLASPRAFGGCCSPGGSLEPFQAT